MQTQPQSSLKTLSMTDLLTFGLNAIAYLKPARVNGQDVFAIHAADGSQLAYVATKEIGVAAMEEHDLAPVALH